MCGALQGTGRPGAPLYRSIRAFVRDAQHNKLLAIPAALYAVNNYLKFAMQLYFKPTTAKMLGNLKVCLRLSACLAPCITMHTSRVVCLSFLSTLVMMPLHLRMQPLGIHTGLLE